jgi:hypothetical protein
MQPALAAPVTWTFNDVTLDIGGTVTGTFVFDAATNLYSDVSIDVDSDFLDARSFSEDPDFFHYDDVSTWPIQWDSSRISMETVWEGYPDGDYLYEVTYQTMAFAQALSNAGGEISIASGWGEFQYARDFSEYGGYRYMVTGGTVSAVPIPGAVWLFGSALVGLGWNLRRKVA